MLCIALFMFMISMISAKKEVHLAVLLPYEGAYFNGNPCSMVMKMAIEDIEKANILPDHQLALHIRDTKCNPGLAVYQMHDLLFTEPVKHLLVGPVCSDACVSTAEAAVYWNITQTTMGCGTPVLSDSKAFPLFMRLNTVDLQANELRIRVLQLYNWKRFAIVHSPSDLFNLVVHDLIIRAQNVSMTVLTSETLTGDFNFTVERIRQSEARIIYVMAYVKVGFQFFCAAYKSGLYGSRYVYVVPGWWEESFYNELVEEAQYLSKCNYSKGLAELSEYGNESNKKEVI